MTSPLNRDVADSTSTGKSAEDLLNEREKKLQYRNDAFNKLRAAHMKEFQAKYTAEQQTILQQEIKKKTEAGKMSACVVSSVIMDKSLRSQYILCSSSNIRTYTTSSLSNALVYGYRRVYGYVWTDEGSSCSY